MIIASILISILLSSMTHITLKIGMNYLNQLAPSSVADWLAVAWTPVGLYVFLGMLFNLMAMLTWLYALKHVDVSYAYPFSALGFVFVMLIAYVFMHEAISLYRLIGVSLIILGILFVSQS